MKKNNYGKKLILAVAIGFFVLLIDFVTKFYTQLKIPLMYGNYPYRGIAVFKNFLGIEFSIVHATNKGAAWGMFADFQVYLIFLRILLIAGLFVYLFFYNKNSKRAIPLALISFGAFGNILDYFLYGHVIDMFHFILWGYDFPVFNVADSAICIGIAGILFASTSEFNKEMINE